MKKILITGGACAGKTTSLKIIKEYLEGKNYKVHIVEEVPTMLIEKGITSKKIGRMEFQELVIKTQIENEKNYNEKYQNEDKTIIIFDGSPIDSLKFIKRNELDEFLTKYNKKYDDFINNYDGIIFLQTIAKKYPELYSNETNKARLLDIDEAIKRNDKILKEYKKYDKTYVINNYKKFETKKDKIIESIDKIIK